MAYFLDTSILVRLASTDDASHVIALHAVQELHRRGETLCITPQCLVEFRSAATRPKSVNGLGASAAAAEMHSATFEATFQLLPETPDIFPAWKSLVSAASVTGKQVHDARLVAVCRVHGVSHLLTFNTGHFTRFATIGVGIAAVHPASI